MSISLWPHGLQHARLICPSPTPRVYSNSCPLSRWCHPTISSSAIPFSSHLQSFPASGSFQMSQFFTSGGQSTGASASASVLSMNECSGLSVPWGSFHNLLSFSIRGQTEWKPQSQKTNQSDHIDHSLVLLSETMSHAMWGHPRWTSHGGNFWQNVVHWRREWQTTSVFFPWEPHEQYEKANRNVTERWTTQVGRCPICYWRKVEK